MLKRNKGSGLSLCSLLGSFVLLWFWLCIIQLEKPISLQTASYLGMCLCLVICTPVHILNWILFTLTHGHLIFFQLPWKWGIYCWLVERNFLVNKVTINSSKHVFLESSVYKIGNKAELFALKSHKRCTAEKKKLGSFKANWTNILFFLLRFMLLTIFMCFRRYAWLCPLRCALSSPLPAVFSQNACRRQSLGFPLFPMGLIASGLPQASVTWVVELHAVPAKVKSLNLFSFRFLFQFTFCLAAVGKDASQAPSLPDEHGQLCTHLNRNDLHFLKVKLILFLRNKEERGLGYFPGS